jgi:Gamma-glutamyl cyclotransferase, AIG2-like
MAGRRFDVFFYGLFMDQQVLEGKGIRPTETQVSAVPGFKLRIGARAALVPAEDEKVHGVLMKLSHADLAALYSEPSVQAYRPEPVLAIAADGSRVAALCYNLPEPQAQMSTMLSTPPRLRALAQRIGLPPEYVTSIR